jgi:thiol-disulfide isomerase/thioredoxin
MNKSLEFLITRRLVAAPVLCLAAMLAAPLAQAGSPADEVQRGFELIDDYVVTKGGEDLPAKIYSSTATRAILVVAEDIATPSVILWPRSREVESLKSMKVQSLPGGFVEVKKDAVAAVEPPFEVVGTNVVFQVNGTEMRLKPKPPLLGLFDTKQMLEKSKTYAGRAESYTPNDEILAKLGALEGTLRVRVFFGSWCPACGQMVPRIMAVAERLGDADLDFEYYGMPKQGFAEDRQAQAYNIKSVPTGVVFVNDLEVGRIQGDEWRSPEAALLQLLGS